MKNILVTGGLGYIGSHTVVALIEKGFHPVVVDDLSNSSPEVLEGIAQITGAKPTWYEQNVCDAAAIEEIMRKEEIHAVIHFAAFKAVGESVEKPLDYFHNNVGGLNAVLQAMSNTGVDHMVFSSSCTVYGDTSLSPIDETHKRSKAISPYGTTKIICEEILEDCATFTPLKVVSLRYFNPVGAHESSLIGELPIGVPNNLVPYITQTAAGIRPELTVFGKDYPTPDGTNIRDFIHVVDLADAHVRSLSFSLEHDFEFEVFNLGTGKGHSVLEVIKSFEKVSGKRLNYSFGPRRAGDVVQIWAKPDKAKSELGWTAERNLDQMMLSAWEWQQSLDS